MSLVTNKNSKIYTPSLAASSSDTTPLQSIEPSPPFLFQEQEIDALHSRLFAQGLVNVEGRATNSLLINHSQLLPIPLDRLQKLDEIPVRKLLCSLNKIYSGRMDHYTLVGGGVPWLLGPKYFQDTLKLWGETTLFSEQLQQEMNREPNDIDIFVHMNNTSTGLFQTMTPTIKSKGYNIVKSNMIVFPGNSALYVQLAMKDQNNRERLVDIMFYNELSSGGYLSSMAALQIPLNDYIDRKNLSSIFPTSKDIAPQQAILDYLLNKLSPHDILNDKGWVRMTHLLKMNAQITQSGDWIRLATHPIRQKKSVSAHLLELIKECECSHPSSHKTGILFNALNALSILRDELNPDEAKELWESLWIRLGSNTDEIDPILITLNKIFSSANCDPYVLFSTLELCGIILEALHPQKNNGIHARHVTSREMLSLQFVFPAEKNVVNTLQIKASPLNAYAIMESHSNILTEEPAWIDCLSLLLMNEALKKNPTSSLRKNLHTLGYIPELLTECIVNAQGPRPHFLQIFDFHLLAAMYTLTPQRDQRIKTALLEMIPLLLRGLSQARGKTLLKTAENILGGGYAKGCAALSNKSTLEIHYQALFADALLETVSSHDSWFSNVINTYDRCQDHLPIETMDRLLRTVFQKTPLEEIELRLHFFRRLKNSSISTDEFYFKSFCQTVYHSMESPRLNLYVREYGEVLLHFFESKLESPNPTPIRLEIVPTIVNNLIKQDFLSLAEQLLKAGDCKAYKPLFDRKHGLLWEKLVQSMPEISIETIPHLEAAIDSKSLSAGLSLSCRYKVSIFQKLTAEKLAEAIVEYGKLIAAHRSPESDADIHKLLHLLFEKADSLLSRSFEVSFHHTSSILEEIKVQNLFTEECVKRVIHLFERMIEGHRSITPHTIQTCVNRYLLIALPSIPTPRKHLFCAQVIELLGFACSSSTPASKLFKESINNSIPNLIEGVSDDFSLQIKLLFLIHGHGIPLNENAHLFYKAILAALNEEQQDPQTLITLFNITKRLQNTHHNLPQEILLISCQRSFEINLIDNGKYWIDVILKQEATLTPENRFILQCLTPGWIQKLHSKGYFDLIKDLTPQIKKLELPPKAWEDIFTEEYTQHNGEASVRFVIEYPFSLLSSTNSEHWRKVVEWGLSKWLSEKSIKEPELLLIIQLLLEAKINRPELWHYAYHHYSKCKNPKHYTKALEGLQKATHEGLLNNHPEYKQLNWEIMIGMISFKEILGLLKKEQEFINAFRQTDGRMDQGFIPLIKKLYEGAISPYKNNSIPPELVNFLTETHIKFDIAFFQSDLEEQLFTLERDLYELISNSITPASYFSFSNSILSRLEKMGPKLNATSEIRLHITALSMITFNQHDNPQLTNTKQLTLNFIGNITDLFKNEPWLIQYLTLIYNAPFEDVRQDIKTKMISWIRKLHCGNICNTEDPNFRESQIVVLYACIKNLINSTKSDPTFFAEILHLAQTKELLGPKISDLWKLLINKQFIQTENPIREQRSITIASSLYEISDLSEDDRLIIYEKLIIAILSHADKHKLICWCSQQLIRIAKVYTTTPQYHPIVCKNRFFRVMPRLINTINNFTEDRPALGLIYNILAKLIAQDRDSNCANSDQIMHMVENYIFEPRYLGIDPNDIKTFYHNSRLLINAVADDTFISKRAHQSFDLCTSYLILTAETHIGEVANGSMKRYELISAERIQAVLNRLGASHSLNSFDHLFAVIANRSLLIEEKLNGSLFMEDFINKLFERFKPDSCMVHKNKYLLDLLTFSLRSYLEVLLQKETEEGFEAGKKIFEQLFTILEYPTTENLIHPRPKYDFASLMTDLLITFKYRGLFKSNAEEYLNYCDRILKTVKEGEEISIINFSKFLRFGLLLTNKEKMELFCRLSGSNMTKYEDLTNAWFKKMIQRDNLTTEYVKELIKTLQSECSEIIPQNDLNMKEILKNLRAISIQKSKNNRASSSTGRR